MQQTDDAKSLISRLQHNELALGGKLRHNQYSEIQQEYDAKSLVSCLQRSKLTLAGKSIIMTQTISRNIQQEYDAKSLVSRFTTQWTNTYRQVNHYAATNIQKYSKNVMESI